jgi:hypothetical protein
LIAFSTWQYKCIWLLLVLDSMWLLLVLDSTNEFDCFLALDSMWLLLVLDSTNVFDCFLALDSNWLLLVLDSIWLLLVLDSIKLLLVIDRIWYLCYLTFHYTCIIYILPFNRRVFGSAWCFSILDNIWLLLLKVSVTDLIDLSIWHFEYLTVFYILKYLAVFATFFSISIPLSVWIVGGVMILVLHVFDNFSLWPWAYLSLLAFDRIWLL